MPSRHPIPLGKAIFIVLGLATLLAGLGNFVFSPEDDGRLSFAVGVSAWTIALLFGLQELNRWQMRDHLQKRYFFLRSLFLATSGVVVAVWFGLEVGAAQLRRELRRDFEARGVQVWPERRPGYWIFIKVVVPPSNFTEEEMKQMRLAYPDASLQSEYPPVIVGGSVDPKQ